jgi:hypothetical protein
MNGTRRLAAKTIAAWKAHQMSLRSDPPRVELNERIYDGLRKAGMPEGEAKTNCQAISE